LLKEVTHALAYFYASEKNVFSFLLSNNQRQVVNMILYNSTLFYNFNTSFLLVTYRCCGKKKQQTVGANTEAARAVTNALIQEEKDEQQKKKNDLAAMKQQLKETPFGRQHEVKFLLH
jgi:hypothetical protein